jgi:anti-sigma regulatory factor (Ser/Thr protein kinase)
MHDGNPGVHRCLENVILEVGVGHELTSDLSHSTTEAYLFVIRHH